MGQSRPAPQSAPGNEVHQLLEAYDRAMRQASSLALIEWIPCRPSRWWLLKPSSRLPRLTLGTRTLLIRHIDRSLAALERRYKAREALGELTAEQAEDRDTCMRYRESLPLGRFVWRVIAFAVPALFLASVLDDLAAYLTGLPFYGATLQVHGKKIQDIVGALASAVASGGNIREMTQVIAKGINLGIADLVALLALVFLVSYVLIRPFVPAFRLKRQILNLADQDVRDVRDTASSWYVNKSLGAYDQERKVFATLGYRAPAEYPLDLVALVFPVVCMIVLVVTMTGAAVSVSAEHGVVLGLFVGLWALSLAGLGVLRMLWLWSAWHGRQHPEQTAPLVGVTGGAGGYVESRPVTEAVAWPFAIALLTALLLGTRLRDLPLYPGAIPLAALLYPPLASISFYRVALTGDRLRAAAAAREGRPAHRGRPLAAALAFASIVATPIVILVHLWRLTGLLGLEESARRRSRVPVVSACLVLLVLTPLVPVFGLSSHAIFCAAVIMVLYALLMGTIQWCQNRLVAEEDLAAPVSYGACEPGGVLKRAPASSCEVSARSGPAAPAPSRRR